MYRGERNVQWIDTRLVEPVAEPGSQDDRSDEIALYKRAKSNVSILPGW
jgi:hypothetical protein